MVVPKRGRGIVVGASHYTSTTDFFEACSTLKLLAQVNKLVGCMDSCLYDDNLGCRLPHQLHHSGVATDGSIPASYVPAWIGYRL